MAYSFNVTKVFKIEGGAFAKGKREVRDVVNVAGRDYMPLSWNNRVVTPLLKKDAKSSKGNRPSGWPRALISCLRDARNAAIDDIIKAFLRAEDPMSDGVELQAYTEKQRSVKFHTAKVPQYVELALPEFTTDSGEHVPGHAIKVLTSPGRNKKVFIELIPSNITWMAKMCERQVEDQGEEDMDSEDETAKIEEFRQRMPDKIHLGINPKKKCSWFIRTYVNRKLKQVTFNYKPTDADEEIKDRLETALKDLQRRATPDVAI